MRLPEDFWALNFQLPNSHLFQHATSLYMDVKKLAKFFRGYFLARPIGRSKTGVLLRTPINLTHTSYCVQWWIASFSRYITQTTDGRQTDDGLQRIRCPYIKGSIPDYCLLPYCYCGRKTVSRKMSCAGQGEFSLSRMITLRGEHSLYGTFHWVSECVSILQVLTSPSTHCMPLPAIWDDFLHHFHWYWQPNIEQSREKKTREKTRNKRKQPKWP